MFLASPGLELELSPRRPADDEDWCRVQVQARANVFAADFEAWLQSTDLERFAEELAVIYGAVGEAGTATLSCAEPDIYLQLSMQRLGGVLGRYSLQTEPHAGGTAKLSGTFEVDQSYLPALRESALILLAQLRQQNAA